MQLEFVMGTTLEAPALCVYIIHENCLCNWTKIVCIFYGTDKIPIPIKFLRDGQTELQQVYLQLNEKCIFTSVEDTRSMGSAPILPEAEVLNFCQSDCYQKSSLLSQNLSP